MVSFKNKIADKKTGNDQKTDKIWKLWFIVVSMQR